MSAEQGKEVPRSLSEIFVGRLRGRIAESFLTQAEVAVRFNAAAKALGVRDRVSASKVQTVASGARKPRLDQVDLWARAVGTSAGFLLGFTWDPRPDDPSSGSLARSDGPGKLIHAPLLTLLTGKDDTLPAARGGGLSGERAGSLARMADMAARRAQRERSHRPKLRRQRTPVPS